MYCHYVLCVRSVTVVKILLRWAAIHGDVNNVQIKRIKVVQKIPPLEQCRRLVHLQSLFQTALLLNVAVVNFVNEREV